MQHLPFNIGATSRAVAIETVWVSKPSDLDAAKDAYAAKHALPASGVWVELDKFALPQAKAS